MIMRSVARTGLLVAFAAIATMGLGCCKKSGERGRRGAGGGRRRRTSSRS